MAFLSFNWIAEASSKSLSADCLWVFDNNVEESGFSNVVLSNGKSREIMRFVINDLCLIPKIEIKLIKINNNNNNNNNNNKGI